MKKTILRGFFRGHPICLHAKFQVSYSTPSRFVKKMTYFCIIFAEKYFPAKYLRFYTSTKNFSKIQPKMSKRQPIKKKNFFLPISPLNLQCNHQHFLLLKKYLELLLWTFCISVQCLTWSTTYRYKETPKEKEDGYHSATTNGNAAPAFQGNISARHFSAAPKNLQN